MTNQKGSEGGMSDARGYREPSGRFAYWNKFDRLCTCGHTLGVHVAGGFDCLNGTKSVPGASGDPCKCEKFKPSRKKVKAP